MTNSGFADFDGTPLTDKDKCDQIFEMLVQVIRSMTPEERKRLGAEAKERKERDRDG
jgi:signal recognition particle GTPase